MVCFKNSTITSKHVHCCIHVRMSCFFWVGILQFFVRTYLVCVASSRPILLVRTSFHTVFSCDNNSVFITLHSEHQQLFWWHVSNKAPSAASMYVHACSTSLGLSVWYYVPHTYVSHISSAPKIRICRYVCTRATSPPPPKKTESPAQAQGATHAQRDSHCTARCV